MSDPAIAAAVGIGIFFLLVLAALIIFVCAWYGGIYKSFKKPVRTTGIVDEAEFVTDDDGGGYYIIRYSYADNAGNRRSAEFRWQRGGYSAGDKIVLHYDSLDPSRCIADCQLKYGKSLWWKIPLILAAIIAPAVIVGMLSMD